MSITENKMFSSPSKLRKQIPRFSGGSVAAAEITIERAPPSVEWRGTLHFVTGR